jgi:hypothetical protein
VDPGRLLAGEYPGHWKTETARRRLASFLGHGVTRFVDLTHRRDGLDPYAEILREEADRLGVVARHSPFPIPDMGVPASRSEMRAVLDCIRDGLHAGETTYVHCWGGIGRTGTVIGCWLVESGLEPEAALATLQQRFLRMPKAHFFGCSPQSEVQFDWVRGWRPGRAGAHDRG